MSDRLLTHVASLLAYSSSCGCQTDKACGKQDSNTTSSSGPEWSLESISYPSLSLSHPPVAEVAVAPVAPKSPTREDIQMKALACMSQPVVFENATTTTTTTMQVEEVSRHMLENFLDSFDQLVDARIRQYSKVLSNHGLSLLSASGRADIVEYKLRTLLEIGTNISFGSISIKFENSAANTSTSTTSDDDTTTLPVMMTVEIDSLQLHGPATTSSKEAPSIDHRHRHKLTFQAPGRIHRQQQEEGISDLDNSCCNSGKLALAKDDAALSRSSNFKKRQLIIIEVDCETLLKEMMEKAGEVVGMVVDLTNQAWANSQEKVILVRNEHLKASNPDSNPESKLPSSSMESTNRSTEKKAGVAKTVSEPELSFRSSESTERNDASHLMDQVGASNGVQVCPRRFIERNAGLGASSPRDSDEENTNPSISAEKASHIIDFVFDEIDDEFMPSIPSPPPSKKPRIEFQ